MNGDVVAGTGERSAHEQCDPVIPATRLLRVVVGWVIRLGLLVLVGWALQACTAPPRACSHNWVGPSSGPFGTAANWDVNAVPGPSASACAPAGSSIVVDGTQSVVKFVSGGTVTIPAGAELQVSGGAPSSIKQLDLSGGTLSGPGSVTVADGTWAGGSVTIGSSLSVTGAVTVTNDVAVASALDSTGMVSLEGASTLDIDRLATPSGSFVLNGASTTLRFAGGSAAVDLSGVTVLGGGRIANPVTGGGILDPEASIGPLVIDGDWTSSAGSALKATVRNTTATGHDELHVVGTAQPSGATLDVGFDPAYAPVTGDSFSLLSATSSVTGTFAAAQLPSAAGHGVHLARAPSTIDLWVTDCDPAMLHPNAALTGSNLASKFLRGCDLSGSVLVGADLTAANLTDANLRYANLASTILTGVVWANTICPDGTNSDANGGTCAGHLPLVFTVNSTTDAVDVTPGDGICRTAATPTTCTLRAAVQEANAVVGKDIITLPKNATLKLTRAGVNENAALTGDLDVTADLVVLGNGATVDANGIDKAFQVLGSASLTVEQTKVTKANGSGGAAAFDNVSGTLDLTNVAVTGTTVGVLSAGITTVRASTISGASNSGIWTTAGTTAITASTVSASGQTNGAILSGGGATTIVDSTVTLSTGFGLRRTGGAMSAQNSIAADQAAGKADCSGSIVSLGYNLVSDTTCAFAATGDSIVADAHLFALTTAGGSIETHLPKQGSPAIDSGMPGCAPTDERGLPRDTDGNNDSVPACDRGAVEAGAWHPLSIQVTSTVDAVDANLGDGICHSAAGDCTLRAAVQESNVTSGPDVIELAPAAVYDLTVKQPGNTPGSGEVEDGSATGDLDIAGALTLHGNGSTIKNEFDGNLDIAAVSPVSLDHLTLDRGQVNPSLHNRSATVTMDRVRVLWGLLRNQATMTMVESEVTTDVLNEATLNVNRSTLTLGIASAGRLTLDHATLREGIVTTSPTTEVIVRDSTIRTLGKSEPFDHAINRDAGGTVTVTNSILDATWWRTACSSPITSSGYNITPDASCGLTGPGDMQNTNPHLGPLERNGGPTRTMLPQTTSAAIDSGRPGCDPIDQRGMTAPTDGDGDGAAACDRGALELADWSPLALVVNDTADVVDANPGDGVCQTATAGHCTVRAAVQEASVSTGPDTIDLQPGVNYALTIPPTSEPMNESGDLDVTTDLLIRGHGATIDAYGFAFSYPNTTIESHGAHIELNDLTLVAPYAGDGLTTYAHTAIALDHVQGRVQSNGPVTANESNLSGRFERGATIERSSIGQDTLFAQSSQVSHSFFPNASMIRVSGQMELRDSTSFTQSNNQSFDVYGALSVVDSTLYNSFQFGSSAIFKLQDPQASVTMTNSIAFAPSGSYTPICSAPIASGGFNVTSDASCGLSGPGDLQSTDPKLSPLTLHGSALPTYVPLTGSPAIDTGRGICGALDARGQARPTDGDGDGTATCDRGAVEIPPWNPLAISPNTTLDKIDATPGDGVCQTNVAGECSLRAAIQEANASTGPDTITLAPLATYTLTLAGAGENEAATGDLDVLTGLTIDGRGATIDVNKLDNGFEVLAGALSIDDLKLNNVRNSYVGILATGDLTLSRLDFGHAPDIVGGGIDAGGSLQLRDSKLSGPGGRVNASGSASIDRVLFVNGASVGTGGTGTMTVRTSTFIASGLGFSNLVDNYGTISIVDSTLAGDPSAVPIRNRPGGNATVTNSILQVVGTSGACAGTVASGGYNLVSDGSCNFAGPGDLVSVTMRLGKLANYGGTSAVLLPLTGSPAIDSGRPGCSGVDQRGFARPIDGDGVVGAVCDRGAAEVPAWNPLDMVVTSTSDRVDANPGNGVCETATPGECTLRAAAQEANRNTGPDTISLAVGTTYTLAIPGAGEDDAATGDVDVWSDVTIHGNGATIDAANLDHAIQVTTTTLTVDSLSLTRGAAGSAIDNVGGSLALANVTVTGSQGLVSSTGTLSIVDSTFTGTAGIAVTSAGTTAVTRSTLSSPNRCATLRGTATLSASTLVGCREGLVVDGSGTDTVTVTSSTLSQSTSSAAGFGIRVDGGRVLVADATLVGARGPALAGYTSTSSITNSIIENQAGQGVVCAAALTSGGYNLVSDASCSFAAVGDLQSVSANLGALVNNGGPTITHRPSEGSPAIDSGNPACGPTDQRGVARPQGAGCDRGAVEQ